MNGDESGKNFLIIVTKSNFCKPLFGDFHRASPTKENTPPRLRERVSVICVGFGDDKVAMDSIPFVIFMIVIFGYF